MLDGDRNSFRKRAGLHFICRADHYISQTQDRTDGHAKGPRVMPLIWTKIKIEDDRGTRGPRTLRGEDGGAAARLTTQPCSGYQQDATLRDRCPQHVIDREFDVRTVITIVN